MSLRRWALISGNNVVNIVDQEDQPVLFTEDDKFWIENPEKNVGPGFFYENGFFVPPVAPTPSSKTYTRLQLINLLDSDYNTIITSSKTDVEVEVWLEKFRLQDAFVISDTNFIDDINFLVSKNLITQEKSNTILNG
jgi:hypothetical protein